MPISRTTGSAATLVAVAVLAGCGGDGPDGLIVPSESTHRPWHTSPPTPTSSPVAAEDRVPSAAVTAEPAATEDPVHAPADAPTDAPSEVPGESPTGDPATRSDDSPPAATSPATSLAESAASEPTGGVTPSEGSEPSQGDDDDGSGSWLDAISEALIGD